MQELDFTPPRPTLKKVRASLSLTDKSKAYLARKEGKKISDIARSVKKSFNGVRAFCHNAGTRRTLEPMHRLKGRFTKGSTKLTERQKSIITKWIENEEIVSCQDAHRRLLRVRNTPRVCYHVVRKFMAELGKWLIPKLKTIISHQNREKRINHCKAIKGQDFKNVLFTDEASFQLNANTLKVFVKKGAERPLKIKFNPNYSLMVWGGISFHGKTDINFVEGWINAERYQDMLIKQKTNIRSIFKIDRSIKATYLQRPGVNNWHFLQDNARVHTTQSSIDCIKKHLTKNILPHPPQSPDLNPIELVWAEMKRQVQLKRPKNKRQLRLAIETCWKQLRIKFIRKCIGGLKRRMTNVIKNKGDLK